MWHAELPRAEARWLAGLCGMGPLEACRLPGSVRLAEDGAGAEIDDTALASLLHLGSLSAERDGRVVYEGDGMVVVFGAIRYPVSGGAPLRPAGAGRKMTGWQAGGM